MIARLNGNVGVLGVHDEDWGHTSFLKRSLAGAPPPPPPPPGGGGGLWRCVHHRTSAHHLFFSPFGRGWGCVQQTWIWAGNGTDNRFQRFFPHLHCVRTQQAPFPFPPFCIRGLEPPHPPGWACGRRGETGVGGCAPHSHAPLAPPSHARTRANTPSGAAPNFLFFPWPGARRRGGLPPARAVSPLPTPLHPAPHPQGHCCLLLPAHVGGVAPPAKDCLTLSTS